MTREPSVQGLASLRWDDHQAAVPANRQAHSASQLFHVNGPGDESLTPASEVKILEGRASLRNHSLLWPSDGITSLSFCNAPNGWIRNSG